MDLKDEASRDRPRPSIRPDTAPVVVPEMRKPPQAKKAHRVGAVGFTIFL